VVERLISISIWKGKGKHGEKGDGSETTGRKTGGRRRITGQASRFFRGREGGNAPSAGRASVAAPELEQNLRGFRIVYGVREAPKPVQLDIDRIFESATGLASRQVLPGMVDAGDNVINDWDETADFILGKRNSIVEGRLHLT
jgi:hypothetical protein